MSYQISRLAAYTSANGAWSFIPSNPNAPFTLYLEEHNSGFLSFRINQGSSLLLNVSSNETNGLKLYKRKPDLAIKYWDNLSSQWCKVQLTFQSPKTYEEVMANLDRGSSGIQVVDKEIHYNTKKKLLDMEDSELKVYVKEKMNDPDFVALVSFT